MGWRAILLISLLFLYACDDAVRTTPVGEAVESPVIEENGTIKFDSCSKVTCPESYACDDGLCVCPDGTKQCDQKCITGCCNDEDCDVGYACVSEKCTELELCRKGEKLIDKKCECDDDHFFCSVQDKCLPKGNCCRDNECSRGERCTDSITRTDVCIKEGSKKVCKALTDNGVSQLFTLRESEFRVGIERFNEDGSLIITVDDKSVELRADEKKEIAGREFFFEEIEEFGGYCKRAEDIRDIYDD